MLHRVALWRISKPLKINIDAAVCPDTLREMRCPHCKKDIPDTTVAKHLASKGGKASKRTITPKQQAAMQAAKKAKRKKP